MNELETVFNRFDANDDGKISADELDSVLRLSFMKQVRKSNLILCFFLLLILSFQYELEPNSGSDIRQDDLPELHRWLFRQWNLRVQRRKLWFRRSIGRRCSVDHSWTELLLLRRRQRCAVPAQLGLRDRRPARPRLAAKSQPAASVVVLGAFGSWRRSISTDHSG